MFFERKKEMKLKKVWLFLAALMMANPAKAELQIDVTLCATPCR